MVEMGVELEMVGGVPVSMRSYLAELVNTFVNYDWEVFSYCPLAANFKFSDITQKISTMTNLLGTTTLEDIFIDEDKAQHEGGDDEPPHEGEGSGIHLTGGLVD